MHRIESKTYGRCLIDGAPIDPKRLDAVPWASCCLRHRKLLEAASKPKPTLWCPRDVMATPRLRSPWTAVQRGLELALEDVAYAEATVDRR